MQLDGAVALVTGGARGLGLTIAQDLQRHGAKVIVADRDAALLDDLPRDLLPVRMDVTQEQEVRSVVSDITEKHEIGRAHV